MKTFKDLFIEAMKEVVLIDFLFGVSIGLGIAIIIIILNK